MTEKILESLWEQLKLSNEIIEKQMALMDRLADLVPLFEIVLNQTSVKLLQQDILKTVEEQERREQARMPGGVSLRLLK